jgi:hypothetical protein
VNDLQPPSWPSSPPPPPPPGPPRRKIAKKWWWIGGVGALLVALIVIGALAPPTKPALSTVPATAASATPTSATLAPTTAPTAAPPTPKPTSTPKPTPAPALFRVAGSGIKQTRDFTVPAEWTIEYTYNCSNFASAGNFIVYVYKSDGSLDSNDSGVNELGKQGSGSTANHNDAGTVYLTIDSECNWTVTAVAG